MRVTRIMEVCIIIVFSSLLRVSKLQHHGLFPHPALLFLYHVLLLVLVKLVTIY